MDSPRLGLGFAVLLRGRYTLLAAALLLLAAMYPLLEFGLLGLGLWTVGFWSVLLGAVRAVGVSRRVQRLARVLALTAVAAGAAAFACYELGMPSHGWVFVVFDGLSFLFLALATAVFLRDVLFSESIDADHLLGAACVYVLVGLTFAYALPVLDNLTGEPLLRSVTPGIVTSDLGPGMARAEYLYFSFVTLSTLGFGDVVPATLLGRLIASVEAIIGQLFLTILVARLIGLHIRRSSP